MNNLRLAVLDYPKLIIQNDIVKLMLADMLQAKQLNFERSDINYVPMSGLDMVSTHFLIYDVSNIYRPKLVLAIRNTYEDRVRRHKLRLPSEEYIQYAPSHLQKRYYEFKASKSTLVDCNAWFVDPDYSFAKTRLPLSEIGYFMLVAHTVKRGFDHWVGATNERFKASRWASLTGRAPEGLEFVHPVVRDPHRLMLVDPLNYAWLMDCLDKYKDLYVHRFEQGPMQDVSGESCLSDQQLEDFLRDKMKHSSQLETLGESTHIA